MVICKCFNNYAKERNYDYHVNFMMLSKTGGQLGVVFIPLQ